MARLHEKDDFWDEHRLIECNGIDHEKIVPPDPLAGVPLVRDTPEHMAKLRELMTQQVFVASPSHGHTINGPLGQGVGVYDPNLAVHYVPAMDPNAPGQFMAVTQAELAEFEAHRKAQWQSWVSAQMQQNAAQQAREHRVRDPGLLGAVVNSLLGDRK